MGCLMTPGIQQANASHIADQTSAITCLKPRLWDKLALVDSHLLLLQPSAHQAYRLPLSEHCAITPTPAQFVWEQSRPVRHAWHAHIPRTLSRICTHEHHLRWTGAPRQGCSIDRIESLDLEEDTSSDGWWSLPVR